MNTRILYLASASALILAQCGPKPDASSKAGAEAAVPKQAVKSEPGLKLPSVAEGLSPHFMAVTSKLEIGHTSFTYAEQENTLALMADIFDGVIQALPESERKDLPANFSFREVLSKLGFDRVKAIGASSRRLADGRYHARTFAYIPEGRKGWLTFSGGPAEPFLFRELAPADADLALEFPLHTKDFAKEALDSAAQWMPAKERAEFDAQVNQKLPPLGLSAREIAEKLGARVALIARLNPDQKLPAGDFGVTLPGADAALVIERLGWLLEPFKQQMMPMITSPEAPVESVEKDGILTVKFRGPMGPAPMDFQPCLWYDSKKNRLIVATRPAYLDALLSTAGKLAAAPEFKQAWQGMPEDGNGCLYLSPRLLGSALDAMQSAMDTPDMAEAKGVLLPIIDKARSLLKQPQAFCYANLPDGNLGAFNSVLPASAGSSPLATISALSIVASLAVPSFNMVTAQAEQMRLMNSGRQLGTMLKIYAADHDGKYPAKLSDLVAEDIAEESLLTVKDAKLGLEEPWLYDATLTESSPPDAIVLASPFAIRKGIKQQRIVVRNDSSVEVVDESVYLQQRGPNLQ